MSQKKPKTKSPDSARSAQDRARLSVTGMPIRLVRIALRELMYREVPSQVPTKPMAPLQAVDLEVSFSGGIRMAAEGMEVILSVAATPDPAFVPVEINVKMSAFFEREPEVSDEALVRFASGPALRIIFPYLRECVSNATSKGLYGPVWLDPMHAQLISDSAGVVHLDD